MPERLSGVGDFGAAQKVLVGGHQHPVGGEDASGVVGVGVDDDGMQSRVLGLQRELGREVEVLAGDVNGEDSAGLKMAAIEGDCLRCEQMDWNGVAGEGVEHQHIVRRRGFVASDREAGVSEYDVDRRLRVAQIGEEGTGEAFDEGIDFVEGDVVSGLAVGGEGAGAETDDADATRPVVTAKIEGEADTGVVGVVGRGQGAKAVAEELGAVLDTSVIEGAGSFGLGREVGLGDAQRAVETA